MDVISVIGLTLGVSVVLALYVFSGIRVAYARGELFPKSLLPVWYAMWGFHHLSVLLASLANVWPLPLSWRLAAVAAAVALACGTATAILGLAQFGSYARSTGQDDPQLISTGIYRWSRNPQVVGWFVLLLGISIAGRSGLALLLTGVFALVLHAYTVRLEEPYLDRVYGEQFGRYKATTPRYLGVPRGAGGAA